MKNKRTQSILTHLVSVSVVLLLIVVIYNSLTLLGRYQHYSQAVNSEEMLEQCNSLFQTIRHFGFERGRVNVVLNFKGPVEKIKPSIDFLRQHKIDGDRELSETLKKLGVLPLYKNIPVIAQISRTQEEINHLRNKYEQQFLMPFGKRDTALDDLWFNTMSRQIRQISFLIFSILQKTDWSKEQEPLAEAYSVLSQLRDHAGPVASYLKAASFNVKSLTRTRIEEIGRRKVFAENYLNKLIFISSEFLDKESFDTVMDFKHHYFELFYPLAQRYIQAVNSETTDPQLEKDYLAIAVKALEKLNNMSGTLELSHKEVSKQLIAARLTDLLVGIVASISAFLIIFYSIYLIYRRIYVRVINSSYIMDQLTQGSLSVEIKAPLIPDEIGDIEKGLEKFRENLQMKVRLIKELQTTLDEIKTLKGIIPICMHCKKIRDDKGAWNQLEKYIVEHSDAEFSHGICEKCMNEKYSKYKK